MTITSIEPIYDCLAHYKLLPEAQITWIGDLFNMEEVSVCVPRAVTKDVFGSGARVMLVGEEEVQMFDEVGGVSLFDNGRRAYAVIQSKNTQTLADVIAAFQSALGGIAVEITIPDHLGTRLTVKESWSEALSKAMIRASNAAAQHFQSLGFITRRRGQLNDIDEREYFGKS